jgi:hypothetical protein
VLRKGIWKKNSNTPLSKQSALERKMRPEIYLGIIV